MTFPESLAIKKAARGGYSTVNLPESIFCKPV
jgi:hypothetical protein